MCRKLGWHSPDGAALPDAASAVRAGILLKFSALYIQLWKESERKGAETDGKS